MTDENIEDEVTLKKFYATYTNRGTQFDEAYLAVYTKM